VSASNKNLELSSGIANNLGFIICRAKVNLIDQLTMAPLLTPQEKDSSNSVIVFNNLHFLAVY
jgi:hypothetical protein